MTTRDRVFDTMFGLLDEHFPSLTAGIIVAGAFLLALLSGAHAQSTNPPVPPAVTLNLALSPADGNAIEQVCKLAMANSTLSIPQATGVGQFCTGLLTKLAEAQKAAQSAASTPHTSTPTTSDGEGAPKEEK